MGSPNNVDLIIGVTKISSKEISVAEWCEILEHALFRIKPCLKYVSGFKTLAQLLNSELMTGYGHFVTPDEVMPSLEGTNFNQKTRFVAIDIWEPAKNARANASHELNRSFLLLTDTGHLAILKLSYFKQTKHYTVCAASLIANSSVDGLKCVLSVDCQEIRNLIVSKSISPFSVLDRLYLLFYNSVADGERRLDSKRQARDMLKQMCDRVA